MSFIHQFCTQLPLGYVHVAAIVLLKIYSIFVIRNKIIRSKKKWTIGVDILNRLVYFQLILWTPLRLPSFFKSILKLPYYEQFIPFLSFSPLPLSSPHSPFHFLLSPCLSLSPYLPSSFLFLFLCLFLSLIYKFCNVGIWENYFSFDSHCKVPWNPVLEFCPIFYNCDYYKRFSRRIWNNFNCILLNSNTHETTVLQMVLHLQNVIPF